MSRGRGTVARIVVVLTSAFLVVVYLISASRFRTESREASDPSVVADPGTNPGQLESVLSLTYLMGAVLIVLGLVFWLQGRGTDARLALLIAGACGLLPLWPYGLACIALGVFMGWGATRASDAVPAEPPATTGGGSDPS
jgi:hypothetical protein